MVETAIREVRANRMVRQFYLFFVGCVVGWTYEVILGFLYGHGFVNRGFLFGPYLPIYGFGLVLLNLLLHQMILRPIRVGGVKVNVVLVFFGIILITTVLEFFTGYLLLEKFGLRLWDYRNYWMNYLGLISFKTSLRFGIGGIFLLYGLVPLTDKLLEQVNINVQKTVMVIILAVMSVDLIITLL